MKKKIICIFILACILLCLCVLPSSATEKGNFRVAVVIDSADIAGFHENGGTLRTFVNLLAASGGTEVTFYYDVANTQMDAELVASLIYFKVNGYRVGLCGDDELAVSNFNNIIKYVIKSASRLVLCEGVGAGALIENGYSVVSHFDIMFSDSEHGAVKTNAQGDTQVKIVLSGSTLSDCERLLNYAKTNDIAILGTNEKTN